MKIGEEILSSEEKNTKSYILIMTTNSVNDCR